MHNIQKHIDNFVIKKTNEGYDLDEVYDFLSVLLICLFGIIPHIFLLIYYITTHLTYMIYLNIFSCLIYIIIYYLLKKEKYFATFCVLVFEVSFYGICSTLLIGSDSYSQLYVLLVLMSLFSFTFFHRISQSLNFLLTIIYTAIFIVLCFYSELNTPFYDQGNSYLFIKGFNLVTVMICILYELAIPIYIKGKVSKIQNEIVFELREQAYKDSLTKLENRRSAGVFFEALKARDVSNGRKDTISITLLDIDDFKKVNDTYGHDIGDKVLIMVADVFRRNLRKSDRVFRWGGEEFLIVTSTNTFDDAYNLLDYIRLKISQETFSESSYNFNFTITGGISELEDFKYDQAIIACDKSLYEGKRQGKNIIVRSDSKSDAVKLLKHY